MRWDQEVKGSNPFGSTSLVVPIRQFLGFAINSLSMRTWVTIAAEELLFRLFGPKVNNMPMLGACVIISRETINDYI